MPTMKTSYLDDKFEKKVYDEAFNEDDTDLICGREALEWIDSKLARAKSNTENYRKLVFLRDVMLAASLCAVRTTQYSITEEVDNATQKLYEILC